MSQPSGSRLARSALIIWDMQYGISTRAFNFNEIVPRIRALRDSAHGSGVPVIYSQHTSLPYEYLNAATIEFFKRRGLDPRLGFMREGSKEWQIIEDLLPTEQDLTLRKHTASFFVGTMLEQMLRNRGVDTLVLTGVSTEAGIEGTARHASYLGFRPIVVEDAVGSSDKEAHEKALWIMKKMLEVWQSDVVLASFKQK